ncbi:hypothetical protein [Antarcticibacterium arcticum]|uniref:hypothetical protein n=1 Tax=Antarcticibacterium arcticum TaxID=2585771 RepID=UPI00143D0986|nr:hypothetical protein [Antarcticibacterium arcticum]
MNSNHAFMAQELPEEEMKMLYSLLGKSLPQKKEAAPQFRFSFRFMKKFMEVDKYQE